MKRRLLSLITAACLANSFASLAFAQTQVPASINYQAFVTDNASPPVPLANVTATNFDVDFRIYNAATGGTVVWAERQTVTIFQGRFNVILGSGVAISGLARPNLDTLFGATPGTAASNTNLFIGITVNAVGATTAAEFAPRQQLVSNPLALRAKSAAVADSVAALSISSGSIAADTITAGQLAASSVSVSELADNAVTNAKMADNAIGTAELANNAVTSAKINDGTIASADIADNAVTNVKMADNAIATAELADNAVTAAKMADGAIATAELADNAVTAAKMADNAVGTDKVSDNSLSASDVDFASADSRSISFHHPQPGAFTTPSVWGTPSLQIDRSTADGGLFYFNAFPSGLAYKATLWFDVNGFLNMRRNTTDGAFAKLNNAGSWSSSSDVSLKKDISPAGGLLEKALRIKPVHFHWKSDLENAPETFGVIAQDVEEVLPELVMKGDSWSVNYSGFGVVAIGALKEQHAIVKGQGGRIESLEKENAELKARLDRLEKALGEIK